MKVKLSGPRREQRTLLLVASLGAMILWVYATYLIAPLRRELSELGHQARSARERLKVLEAATANEATLREQSNQLDQAVASLRSYLPAESQVPAVIEELSSFARQAQVKIQTIFPQQPPPNPSKDKTGAAPQPSTSEPVVYKDVLIHIEGVAGFHQLGSFLSLVETGRMPIQVASLQISSNQKESRRQRVKLVLQAYVAADEEPSG